MFIRLGAIRHASFPTHFSTHRLEQIRFPRWLKFKFTQRHVISPLENLLEEGKENLRHGWFHHWRSGSNWRTKRERRYMFTGVGRVPSIGKHKSGRTFGSAAKPRTSRCIPLEKMVDWSTESGVSFTRCRVQLAGTNWTCARVASRWTKRRSGRRSWCAAGYPRAFPLAFFSFHAALARPYSRIPRRSRPYSARFSSWFAHRHVALRIARGRVLIKFGTRHRGAEFRTSCTPSLRGPREGRWLSS